MKSIDRNPINAAQPHCADAEKTRAQLKASQPRHADSHSEESQRPTAAQPRLADFHSEESQRPTAAQPRHARATSDRFPSDALQTQPIRQRRGTRAEDEHAAREEAQQPTATQPRLADFHSEESQRPTAAQPRQARATSERFQPDALQTQPVRQRRGTRAEDERAAREEAQKPTAGQLRLEDSHSEESQRPLAVQPRLAGFHSEEFQRSTAAQPRHARGTSDRLQPEELRTQPVKQRRDTRAEDEHAAREEARRATAGQARHTKEARSTHEALRAKQRYCESMNAVHPSGQFLARLEGEMCRGLQKRRALSPRRLLLPAAAVLMVFVIMLNLVARQARHAGVPVPVSDLQPSSAAAPIESQMANASKPQSATPSESQMANASKPQSATPSDSQMANASKPQSATPSESQMANASEPQSATPSEFQTANATEGQAATPSEFQTANASEDQAAMPSEFQTANASEPQAATPSDSQMANATEPQAATPSEIQTASASEAEPRRETAMTEEEARARVLEIDMDAATADTIFPVPCAESDGAFVFVRQTMDDANMTANGRVWYVTPTDAWLLAQKEVIWGWSPDLDGFSPEVFFICHGVDFDRSALAWTVIDGRPVEIQNAPSLYDLEITRGALMGYVGFKDYDNVFLGVDTSDPENVLLYQIEGIELTREQFLTFPGAEDVLELVEGDGYFSIYQFLYWQDCAMALNFMRGDSEYTTYLYFVDGKLECRGGWFGDDIGLAEGKATPLRDLPIPVRQTHLNANP